MVSHDIETSTVPARSRFSVQSTSSRTNLMDPDEKTLNGSLPSYSTTSVSRHPESPRMKTGFAGIFQGWRVIVLGSCTYWRYLCLFVLTRMLFAGLNILLVMLPISASPFPSWVAKVNVNVSCSGSSSLL